MPHFPCFGLTGGIACGKSTVASFFAALGAKVIQADEIGHEFLRTPGPVFHQVVEHFGAGVLDDSGQIDRRRVAAIVFSDPQQRGWLERILHPRIIERQEELALARHRENPQSVIVIEAALIYEAHVEGRFTKIIVAWCTREQQIERLAAKAHLTREDAVLRIASQMSGDEKRARADFVIDCSLGIEETCRQVEELYPVLQRIMREGTAITSS